MADKPDKEPVMIVKYWGVRGSVPAPITPDEIKKKQVELLKELFSKGRLHNLTYQQLLQEEYVNALFTDLSPSLVGTYGGNTTCIEIQAKDSPLIILDAGTGIRPLGDELMKRMFMKKNFNPLNTKPEYNNQIHLWFTHYHWDHIQGIPFFAPIFFDPEKTPSGMEAPVIHFYGKMDATEQISDVLARQQQYPNFPVKWYELPCNKEYTPLARLVSRKIPIGMAEVTYQELTHPDSVFAYRVNVCGKGFVDATDTEHKDHPDPRLVRLAFGADVLYYDVQYTPEDYLGIEGSETGKFDKFDWGHSTYVWAIKNALEACVRTVVCGHHDPKRTDAMLDNVYLRARILKDHILAQKDMATEKTLELLMAREGMEHRMFI